MDRHAPTAGNGPGRNWRQEGDDARDRRSWLAAGHAYRNYLNSFPDDAPIWVQYGHAMKEQGLRELAEEAYKRAVKIAPGDGDAHLHLGHLFKLTERFDAAAQSYSSSYSLSRNSEALRELHRMREAKHLLTSSDSLLKLPPLVYLDIGDFLEVVSKDATVTGITRTQLGLITYVLNEDATPVSAYEFVAKSGIDELFSIPRDLMRQIVRARNAPQLDLQKLRQLVSTTMAGARRIQASCGDCYVMIGAFWLSVPDPQFLAKMNANGIILGAYFYDVIPITHPHLCDTAFAQAFTAAFAETISVLDFALAISGSAAAEVKRLSILAGRPNLSVIAAPLAHDFSGLKIRDGDLRSVRHVETRDRPFVLCVGTIEARKNHLFLFNIWRHLIDEGLDVPELYFVGRMGWRVADVVAQIASSSYLDGRLHIINDLEDAGLAQLYRSCLFTAFPSFVEGWGLPVGESLAHGKICVTSNASSLPEVGGECAIYVDPYNLRSGIEVVKRLITDQLYREEHEQKIKNTFVGRSWSDSAAYFFASLESLLAQCDLGAGKVSSIFSPKLAPGQLLLVSELRQPAAVRSDYLTRPLRLMFSEGWRSIDVGGAWILDRTARLRFMTDCDPASEIVAVMLFFAVPWIQNNVLHVDGWARASSSAKRRHSTSRVIQPGDRFWLKVYGSVGTDGAVEFRFRVDGDIRSNPPGEDRKLCIRLAKIGYAPIADISCRCELMEEMVLEISSPGPTP